MLAKVLCLLVTVAFVCCVASVVAPTGKPPRQVTCDGTQKVIPDGATDLYSLRLFNSTLNFDTLALFMGVGFGGVDLGEYLATIGGVLKTANDPKLDVDAVNAVWNATWINLSNDLLAEARLYLANGDNVSAASALHRASSYLQLAGRFGNLRSPQALQVYMDSVKVFVQALKLVTPNNVACVQVFFPFENGTSMHGYFCPARGKHATGTSPTLIVINGYDGTSEMDYYQAAGSYTNYGFNVILFEGPGQGWTARVGGLHFIPDFERATSAVLTFAIENFGIDSHSVFVMGESFGGYLAPRSFAYDDRFLGLIANGGVYDFYQSMLCHFPQMLISLYLSGDPAQRAKFNAILESFMGEQLGLNFMMQYGGLGFGAKDFADLLDLLQPYNLINDMDKFSNRNIFVYDPAWDTLTGNQSQIFWAHTSEVSPFSRIVQLDPKRGAGLHCAVGSTANFPIAVASWMNYVLRNYVKEAKK